MAYEVSSWFIEQTEKRFLEPVRKFFISGSDYSDRIDNYPVIKKTANQIRSTKVNARLANTDGEFNMFYSNPETMVAECEYKFGFTHPTSGDELISVYKGTITNVSYSNRYCNLSLRDKIWDFTQFKIGDTTSSVSFSPIIPSDIAWTLCSCYGQLSNIESTSNLDINYETFLEWAAVFSRDSVIMQAYYSGTKVSEALKSLGEQTGSQIWVDGEHKISFGRFTAVDTYDTTITRDNYDSFQIDIDGNDLINRQSVGFDYSVDSRYHEGTIIQEGSASVNTFGPYENLMGDKTIWYTNSQGAISFAQRRIDTLSEPPQIFTVGGGLLGLHKEIGDIISFVESFYSIDSSDAFRFTEHIFDMSAGTVTYTTDGVKLLDPFILDVSTLDGFHRLL